MQTRKSGFTEARTDTTGVLARRFLGLVEPRERFVDALDQIRHVADRNRVVDDMSGDDVGGQFDQLFVFH
jgi:hypothetical protein